MDVWEVYGSSEVWWWRSSALSYSYMVAIELVGEMDVGGEDGGDSYGFSGGILMESMNAQFSKRVRIVSSSGPVSWLSSLVPLFGSWMMASTVEEVGLSIGLMMPVSFVVLKW